MSEQTWYRTEERAFAPGIAEGWPTVIPAPHSKHGRLVRQSGDPDRLHAIIQGCAQCLPEDWGITLEIEREGGGVDLYDPTGSRVDFPSNRETLHEQFSDALQYAIEKAAKQALVVNYPDPQTWLIKRDIANNKLVFFQSKVTRETGVYSESMAIGVGTQHYADHPNWCILRVTAMASPQARGDQRTWLEDYLSGPDWQDGIGMKEQVSK